MHPNYHNGRRKMRLTQASIERLKSDKPDAIFYDDDVDGFGVRIRQGGSRTYVVRYRLGGLERRHNLGKVGVLTLDEARKKARKALTDVDEGRDPTAEKATKQASASLLFSAVAADYLAAKRSTMKSRTLVDVTRYLNRDWKPFHKLPVASVSRAIVASHLREIAKKGGPTANRARSVLSAMYAWAIGEGLCETNPVDGTNKPAGINKRDRVMSDPELAAIWNAVNDSDFGRIVKLLILTAQRRNEIGELRWSEIDMATATITLPAERTKNRQAHTIPLSADALEILRSIPHRNERELVFGDAAGGFAGWGAAKAALDKRLGSSVKPWTLHDLRRTGATRMADSGIQPHIIEAVLNHISGHKGGVAGIYNRAAYEPEKRAALDTLATYIRTAVAKAEGANVTRLRA
jgi:integrase